MHYFLMWENKTATAVNINLWSLQQQQFDPKLKREILISVCCLSKCVWRSVHVLRATDGDVRTQAFSLFFVIFLCFLFCCWWFHASYYDGANLMCILIKGSINANSTFQTKPASCVFSKLLQRRTCALNCFNHFKVRVCFKFWQPGCGVLTVRCAFCSLHRGECFSCYFLFLRQPSPTKRKPDQPAAHDEPRQHHDRLISCCAVETQSFDRRRQRPDQD